MEPYTKPYSDTVRLTATGCVHREPPNVGLTLSSIEAPIVRNLGTTPILKKNALGVKRPFSEQLSEFRGILGAILGMALNESRPNLCENPILGATLGATLRIGWTPKFQPKFSERYFQNWGGSRAPEIENRTTPRIAGQESPEIPRQGAQN